MNCNPCYSFISIYTNASFEIISTVVKPTYNFWRGWCYQRALESLVRAVPTCFEQSKSEHSLFLTFGQLECALEYCVDYILFAPKKETYPPDRYDVFVSSPSPSRTECSIVPAFSGKSHTPLTGPAGPQPHTFLCSWPTHSVTSRPFGYRIILF